MIYLSLGVLLLGQLALGIGLLRLSGKLRAVRNTAVNADNPWDDIPAALQPGSIIPRDDREPGWQVWVVLTGAHAGLGNELRTLPREIPAGFRLRVLLADDLPAGLDIGPDHDALPVICMIDPSGTIQGAGRITTADEVDGFIEEGVQHGLGPHRALADEPSNGVPNPASPVSTVSP